MPAVPSRRVEYAVIGLTLLVASYLLFVPPIVGLADQGDYSRLTTRVGLAPPSLTSYLDQITCWVVTHWNIVAARPLPVFSTGEFPVRTAILLHKAATSATTLDIRWVSGVYLALFLGLILAVLRSARKLPAAAYFVIAAGLVLVCTDSEYISYFNSFLTESAALLGVFAFVAAGLAAVTAEDPSWLHMAALVPAAAFLAGSKAQNAVLGALAACWIVWLFRRKPAQRSAAMAAGLGLVCFSGFVLTRAPLPESNLFNTIYDRVIPNSTDPQQAIAELGLKPETVAAWVGQAYWAVKIDSPDSYPGKATRLRLLTFYLRHPLIDLRMARGALTLSNDLEGMGNFSKESGAPRTTRTQALHQEHQVMVPAMSIWLSSGLSSLQQLARRLLLDFLSGAHRDEHHAVGIRFAQCLEQAWTAERHAVDDDRVTTDVEGLGLACIDPRPAILRIPGTCLTREFERTILEHEVARVAEEALILRALHAGVWGGVRDEDHVP